MTDASTADASMTGARQDRHGRWWIVTGMGLAVFMASLDMSVVNLALPAIRDTFGAGTATTQWVVLGYLLPLVALALPAGRWLDTVDHRAVLVCSCAGFAVSSVAAALAPGIGWLIAARVLQGLFGSALMTLIPVLISTSVGAEVRGRAMGLVDTLGMLGLISGPAIGGLIVDSVGWPWIFYLNVPVCAALIALAYVQLPRSVRIGPPDRDAAVEAAVLISAAGIVMIALTLAAGRTPQLLGLGLAAVPLIMFWKRIPVSLPVRELLALPAMHGPLVALAATAAATGLVFYIVPFHLITVLDLPVAVAGVTMLAFPLAAAVLGPAAGFLADRYGDRRIALAGTVTLVCGLLLLVPASQSWGSADVAWRLAVAGAGIGLFNAPNMSAAMSASPGALLATTGAATSVARQGGFACGPAIATLVWALSGYRPEGIPAVFIAAAAVVAAGAFPLARSLRAPGLADLWINRLSSLWSACRRGLWTVRLRLRGLWKSRLRDPFFPLPGPASPTATAGGGRRTLTTTQDLNAMHGPDRIGVPMSQKLRGREGEERQIIRMLHTVASEASAVLYLEGGWGSGRTRLLREAADAAVRLGFTVVDGDWHPGAEPPALADDSPSRQPVLVVLDDLQHADPAFAHRLRTLPWKLRDRPIAWLLSRRRGAGGPATHQLFATTYPSGGRVDLRPLSPQAVRLLASDYLYGAVTALPSLLRAAGGNPLLTIELVRGLHGEGLNGSAIHPPMRVQSCVRRCLTELSAGCRWLLQVGAVLGIRFELNDVAIMLHRPAAELLAPLDEALAADILGCDGDRLVFAQELFWRSLLKALPDPARVALQQEAAANDVSLTVPEDIPETESIPETVPATVVDTTVVEPGREPRDKTSGDGGKASGWASLNDIERKVAQLVSQGLTNQQIASHVFRSPHTVNYHLRQIFRKLNIHSRVELARLTLTHYPAGGPAGG